jgi:hypothetical protein
MGTPFTAWFGFPPSMGGCTCTNTLVWSEPTWIDATAIVSQQACSATSFQVGVGVFWGPRHPSPNTFPLRLLVMWTSDINGVAGTSVTSKYYLLSGFLLLLFYFNFFADEGSYFTFPPGTMEYMAANSIYC